MKKKIIKYAILLLCVCVAPAWAQGNNPLDQSSQEDKPLTAGELVSFILEWADAETGLSPTMIAKSETKNPLPYHSYTYPNALLCQALFITGRSKELSKIAETFRRKQEGRNLPNSFNYLDGLCDDPVISAGPNAYWGISFLRQYFG